MTPNEINVLRIIEENDSVIKRKIAAILGLSTDYAGYILERMAQGEYLGKVSRGRYSILPKGIDALLSQLYLHDSKLKAQIEKLQMEREWILQETDRLIKRKSNIFIALSPIEERV